jgi:hypothetical protein
MPLQFKDPSGLIWGIKIVGEGLWDAQWFESREEMEKAGFNLMTNFLRKDPNGEGYISFDRFANYHEKVSSAAVLYGWTNMGETMARINGITSRINLSFAFFDAIPNLLDAAYRTKTAQDILNSHEMNFLGTYSGLAAVEYNASRVAPVLMEGLSMEGLAYELRFAPKHLPGNPMPKTGNLQVFNDLATRSRVESEIFARGVPTGNRADWLRVGVRFDDVIGYQTNADGTRIPLTYGQMKIDANGFYHLVLRTGPGKP